MRPAYWELHIPGKHVNPIVCGRKFCSTCGRWRHLVYFVRENDAPRSICITCASRRERAKPRPRPTKRVLLDPAPLLALLDRLPVSEYKYLAELAHVPERSIFRLRRGESKRVELDLADKLILALGSHLSLVYGDAELEQLPNPNPYSA